MNNQIGLGIFGTFGEPHGFQQVFYYGAQFRGSLDLNDNAIEFYPGADLYAVRREIVDGVHSICVCIYSYAQELNTTRMGTFLGSCMVLQDGFTEAEYVYKVLHSMHDDLMSNPDNVEDQVIKVEQGSDIIIREPAEFVAAQANLIPLNRTPFFSAYVDEDKKYLVVPSWHAFGNSEKEVIDFIDEALKHYSDTGTVYFSFDKNVYEFVRSAGIIPVLEWDDFIDRKAQMQQSTAVRTKKGIQKTFTPETSQEVDNNDQQSDAETNTSASTVYYDEDVTEANNDPFKPFILWEQPEEPWTETEIRYRVNEYNRLFRYTNTLVEHVDEPPPEEDKRGRRRVLVAGTLLLLISGSVAVYYFGVYNPMQGTVKIAGAPVNPRAVQQSNIVTDSTAAVLAVDSSVSAEMAASVESKSKNMASPVTYEDILADIKALEAKFDESINVQSAKAVTTDNAPTSDEHGAQNVATGKEPAATAPAASPAVSSPVSIQTPPATPTHGLASTGPSDKSAIPDIHMPAMPRANLPESALYSGKPRTEPAYVDFKSITDVVPPANKPATAEKIVKQDKVVPATAPTEAKVSSAKGQPTADVAATSTPVVQPTVTPPAAATKAPVSSVTSQAVAPITKTTTPVVQTVVATKTATTTPTATLAPIAAKEVAPATAQPHTASPATAQPIAPATVQPATTVTLAATTSNKGPNVAVQAPATATPLTKPAAAAVNVPVTVSNTTPKPISTTSVAPAVPSVSVAAAPSSVKSASVQATGIPATTSKRDSNKLPAQGASAGNSASTFAMSKGPISSGVSAGEMSRANAVALPQLKTAPDPEQIKLKTLYPRPNGTITQRDIPFLAQAGIKNKTLTQLTQLIMDNAPESVGKFYKGQELQYAAALLNNNRQAFQRIGDDYVCTGDYLILHIPAIIKPSRPAVFPK